VDKLDQTDLDHLRSTGRDPSVVFAQLRRLRLGPAWTRLRRACTLGDGLRALEPADWADLESRAALAASRGRLMAFVPASGAATRMFADLVRIRRSGVTRLDELRATAEPSLAVGVEVLERVQELALWPDLVAGLERRGQLADVLAGHLGPLLALLLDPDGLDATRLPKALVPFHRYPGGTRTAMEEQLVEAAALVADDAGRCRVHLTVAEEHLPRFHDQLAAIRPAVEARLGVRLEVELSIQDPTTSTPCVDVDGFPIRDEQGRLLFRPGGHGALLANLEATGGDVVLIKNIDNVVVDELRSRVILPWRRRLVGLLLHLQDRVFELARGVEAGRPGAVEQAAEFLTREFGLRLPTEPALLPPAVRRELHRPMRVCGMVVNRGHPGGGPFWIDGDRPQIVEGAQVDLGDPAQQELWQSSTHFNPVEIVAGLRDHQDRRYDLAEHLDPAAVIVTRKQLGARRAWVYEHPGLWNGSMAAWNSAFVEIPAECFAPVKSLAGLLRREHRG